ncbi:hypothetical protein PMIN06_004168 [Paraphaeosphaeria minitans]
MTDLNRSDPVNDGGYRDFILLDDKGVENQTILVFRSGMNVNQDLDMDAQEFLYVDEFNKMRIPCECMSIIQVSQELGGRGLKSCATRKTRGSRPMQMCAECGPSGIPTMKDIIYPTRRGPEMRPRSSAGSCLIGGDAKQQSHLWAWFA